MVQDIYLMESDEESLRLDMKTDPRDVESQARWAGIEPGMRVATLVDRRFPCVASCPD